MGGERGGGMHDGRVGWPDGCRGKKDDLEDSTFCGDSSGPMTHQVGVGAHQSINSLLLTFH